MCLTYSHDPSKWPMYKGLEAREGHSFSLTSPSHFWNSTLTWIIHGDLFLMSATQHTLGHLGKEGRVRVRAQKREGDVSDIHSHSRASNPLYIGLWGPWCEYVRAKMTFIGSQAFSLITWWMVGSALLSIQSCWINRTSLSYFSADFLGFLWNLRIFS